jgi:phenylalanyl-tRNA synthetase beta chain
VQAGSPIVVAEVEIEPLLRLYPPARTLRPLARFPAIERDLSIVVEEAVTWEQILAQVVAAQPALLEEVRFLVTYRGKPIDQGQKSVSFRMLFRDPANTLRHEQVDGQVNAVIARLRESLKAELRA